MDYVDLRALPVGPIEPNVKCIAKKDLFWSDEQKQNLHALAGTRGLVYYRTEAGFLTSFSNGEKRQVLDNTVESEIELM